MFPGSGFFSAALAESWFPILSVSCGSALLSVCWEKQPPPLGFMVVFCPSPVRDSGAWEMCSVDMRLPCLPVWGDDAVPPPRRAPALREKSEDSALL